MFPLSSRRIHIISCQLKKLIVNSSKGKTWLEILQDKSHSDEEWSKFIKLYTAHSSLQKQHREKGDKNKERKQLHVGKKEEREIEVVLILNQDVIPNIN